MVASSEQHNAPVMVSKPANAQASSSQPGAPLNRDVSTEVIKIPDPIIEPTTIMVASLGPSARTRPDDGRVAALSLTNQLRSRSDPGEALISSFSARRTYLNALAFELCSQFTHELNCARCIAMNTNCFATHIDIAAFDRAHFPFTQHPQDALCGFFWIVQQCIRSRARNEPSVIQVVAIGKNFWRDF